MQGQKITHPFGIAKNNNWTYPNYLAMLRMKQCMQDVEKAFPIFDPKYLQEVKK